MMSWRQPPYEAPHCPQTFEDHLRENFSFNQYLDHMKKQWQEEQDKKNKDKKPPETIFQKNRNLVTWWLFFLSPFGMALSYVEVQFMFKLLQAYGLK